MHFTDDELIAYLLGDAPEGLAQRIVARLAHDRPLMERFNHLRLVLGHLESLDSNYEPPANLVDSTMERIAAEDLSAEVRNAHERDEDELPVHSAGQRGAVELAGQLSEALETPRGRRSAWDSSALTLSLTVLCCLALPALVGARFEARKAACADHMRRTGIALGSYAQNDPEHRFPRIPLEGPMAFAGFCAVELNQAGYLQSPMQLFCPSLGPPDESLKDAGLLSQEQFAAGVLPTAEQLKQLPPPLLRVSQAKLGGHYAWGLGVMEGNRPVAPRNEGRSNFAILADAPVIEGGVESFIVHDGNGINILFDDGHVRFVSLERINPAQPHSKPNLVILGDDPFRNQQGHHQVGLHPQDASLAPSHFSPLGAR